MLIFFNGNRLHPSFWYTVFKGNLTAKHIKFNVCKNDCTCARNIMSFNLLYVNGNAKNGCFCC